jgi:hypothetical protein
MHWVARLLAACVVGVIAGALMVWATGGVSPFYTLSADAVAFGLALNEMRPTGE